MGLARDVLADNNLCISPACYISTFLLTPWVRWHLWLHGSTIKCRQFCLPLWHLWLLLIEIGQLIRSIPIYMSLS
jgi:hypothetical protein